ncbi:metallophosphoesterase [Rubritalea marina]|uniref:metallophosphoesterase n=1 Tax=Rubritalea marina TaxID=361055 RepID=UPI00035FEF93|nr:metallophosphoesterase [Rubritalea marina]
MALYCIGDIHGKFDRLNQVIADIPDHTTIVCVGDIGLGFTDANDPSCLAEVDATATSKSQTIWLLRGNHDDPAIWHNHRHEWNSALHSIRIPNDIHRMKVDNIHVIMVGGAISLDRSHPGRVDGLNWWNGEGMNLNSVKHVEQFVESYGRADILITHCGSINAEPGPERDAETFEHYGKVDQTLKADAVRERETVAQLVEASQTRTAVFGHYHVPIESHQGPIRYRCCAELEAWEYVKRSVLPPLPQL